MPRPSNPCCADEGGAGGGGEGEDDDVEDDTDPWMLPITHEVRDCNIWSLTSQPSIVEPRTSNAAVQVKLPSCARFL
jgi:hypothetical protein